jgi:mannose/cellobiose epimerase-like protein (N-acyl-D-glucosamine 2-epimerase family)
MPPTMPWAMPRTMLLAAVLLAGSGAIAAAEPAGPAGPGGPDPLAGPAQRPGSAAAATADPDHPAVAALPPPGRWRAHVTDDLARFWLDPRYRGDPVGAFPTFIGPEGCVWEPGAACTSLAHVPEWIAPELGRRHVRMVSRQTYTYAAVFHLTGDVQALRLARAGARWILTAAYEPRHGSVASWITDSGRGPDPAARTTQDLAYALLGPAMLYRLTGDPGLLAFLEAVKDHIFTAYWSEDRGLLRWSNAPAGPAGRGRSELVAQLDQINAYLLLVTPLLNGEQRTRWEDDLARLGTVLWRTFHDPERHRFCGWRHGPTGCLWGERHNDFGHTTKAYWMLERAGQLLGREDWVVRARAGLDDVLEDALVRRHLDVAPEPLRPALAGAADSTGTYWVWSNRPDGDGIAWWEWCELDQAALTLALTEPRHARAVARTAPAWFATMVDPASGAVLPSPGARDAPRAHHWQNGYHAAEHALVAFIATSMLRGDPWRLFFAPADPAHPLRSYLLGLGEQVTARRVQEAGAADGTPVVAVTFTRR